MVNVTGNQQVKILYDQVKQIVKVRAQLATIFRVRFLLNPVSELVPTINVISMFQFPLHHAIQLMMYALWAVQLKQSKHYLYNNENRMKTIIHLKLKRFH